MTAPAAAPRFRPAWVRRRAGVVVVAALLPLGALRAIGLHGPPALRAALPLGFLLMLALTALLLTAAGRREAGLTAVPRPWWLLAGPVLGALAALGIGALGTALYGHGADHWYHSVRAAALANPGLAALSPRGQWLAFTLPAIAFSPLGEECFFRGLLELSLRERWGRRAAVAGSAVAFGAIHLLHHGVAWGAGGVTLRPVPGLLWFVLMALTGGLLSWCRARGGALWVAVAAHAGFNAAMGWVVFH